MDLGGGNAFGGDIPGLPPPLYESLDRMYITSARGHEFSGCVRAHTYNYMPGDVLQKSF